jgi:hypothetical protein
VLGEDAARAIDVLEAIVANDPAARAVRVDSARVARAATQRFDVRLTGAGHLEGRAFDLTSIDDIGADEAR